MKSKESGNLKKIPLLYYKTKKDIETHRKKPAELKLQWLEAQMEFFHKAMPPEAKRIREKLRNPGLRIPIRGVSLSREILKERKQSKR